MKKNSWAKIIWMFILSNIALIFFNVARAASLPSDTIRVGMTTALSGPAKDLGQSMKEGVEAYFDSINAAGGLKGKKIKLIALDDQYEPLFAGPNMHRLIEKDKVIAVIGNVGTPTAVVTVPIANQEKILFFAPFTGAGILRKIPPDRYVINLRASYAEETAAMIKGLLSIGIKPDEMAFFTQNDAYGDSGYTGAMSALKAAGYLHPELLPYGRYKRNTLNVEAALGEIMTASKPIRAIIMVGAYAPSAKFILLAKKQFPNALFLNVSFVGADALAAALGKNGDRVIVTQVVPYLNVNLPAVIDYHKDLNKYFPGVQPGFVSLEGYLAAKLFVIGLQKAIDQNKLTSEGLIDTFESMHDVDIGINKKISFDKNNHQALHTIWVTVLKNGKLEPLTDWSTLLIKKKE